jgi:hypothetical protein
MPLRRSLIVAGKAVGKGAAEVVVQFKGSTNGLGTPTTFTITVE